MAQVPKIDSNITGLAYAEEAALGSLPGENGFGGTPVWKRLNPNSYDDFGGEIVTVAPNPINPSRQRRKGVTTDLNASGGFNHNLTFTNLTDIMQSFMFADIREKGRETVTAVDIDGGNPDEYEVASTTGFIAGSIIKGKNFTNSANNGLNVVTAIVSNTSVEVATGQLTAEASPPADAEIQVVGFQFADADAQIVVSGDLPVMSSVGALVNFSNLGIVPGQWVFIGGDTTSSRFANTANNGYKRVRSVSATQIVFDKSTSTMVVEAAASGKFIRLFFGDVLRNETGDLIVRRSYNIERTLGAPDDSQPTQIQSEVLIGAVGNELTINVPQANLVNVDLAFIGIDNIQRDGPTGPKQSSVQIFDAASEYNTSSDVVRFNLSSVDDTTEAPTSLTRYITELKITINNNVSPNKAIGILGAFDVTAGTFAVSGSLTAYFSSVAAVQQVRNNGDVSLDISFAKDNTGIVYDMPLIALGDGRLKVEVDQPITIPLNTDAASGEDIHEDLDHTLCITYFNYLPDAAM
jgi:hypothetical protein